LLPIAFEQSHHDVNTKSAANGGRLFDKDGENLGDSEVYSDSSFDQKYGSSLFGFKNLREDSLLPSDDDDCDPEDDEPLFDQYDKIMGTVSENLQKLSSAVKIYQTRANEKLKDMRYTKFMRAEEMDSEILDPGLVILEDDDDFLEEEFPSQNASSDLRTLTENQGKMSTLS